MFRILKIPGIYIGDFQRIRQSHTLFYKKLNNPKLLMAQGSCNVSA